MPHEHLDETSFAIACLALIFAMTGMILPTAPTTTTTTSTTPEPSPTWTRDYALPRGVWIKYQTNYVLGLGAAGKFDDTNVEGDSVLFINNTYYMWYSGYRTTDAKYRIGLATSTNGINWTRYAGSGSYDSVLDVGGAGTWDANRVRWPTVLYNGTMFRMWYTGLLTGSYYKIGYAESVDGYTWTKYASNPVISPGAAGQWDDYWTLNPQVLQLGNDLWMLYVGYKDTTATYALGVAHCRNTDGITWKKYTGNPVLSKGAASDFDSNRPYFPGVYYEAGVFYIIYAGYNTTVYQLGSAFSPNGVNFTKYDYNPIFACTNNAADWDYWKEAPSVIRQNNTFYMWYAGAANAQDPKGIGLAYITVSG